jgi:hypothetical protein
MKLAIIPALLLLLLVSDEVSAQEITNQSSVAQGLCQGGRNYWYQGQKYKDGTLCTKFSFNQFFSFPILWDPKWNAAARKRYCKDSEKDNCFIK